VNYNGSAEAATAVVHDIESAGGRALAIRADTSDAAAVKAMFDTATEALGPIAGLVNNAGLVNRRALIDELDIEETRRLLEVNVLGCMICAAEAVRRMAHRHGGAGGVIVNISSGAARIGGAGEIVTYAATKGAIDTFTKGLSIEVGPEGIRVNALRPGLMDTDMRYGTGEEKRFERLLPGVPLGRIGTPEDLAGAVSWLFSKDADYVAGAIIDVTGGR